MSLSFQKNIENFECLHCGNSVKGNGYTNHCPKCLWSRHVDINPGDRSESCQGLMEPVGAELKDGNYVIVHKCVECQFVRRNKMQNKDDFDEVVKLTLIPVHY